MSKRQRKPKRSYKKYDPESEKLDFTFSYNEKETAELHARLNNSTSITENDLRRVLLWKSDRVLSVVKDVIERLVISQGIGFPMASAILKFIKPEVFPILDVRAYRALTGEKPYYGTYSYERYIEYAEKLTELAAKLKRPLREIDEQLYCYDQKNNGEI